MSEYSAKDIRVAPIKKADADKLVKRLHYSGSVVMNSQLHLGVFLNGRLEGCMQFGPPLDKRKIMGLVDGTGWNEFLELNRMAFSERLPRNSESRAIAVAMRLIRSHYKHIQWVVSFADGSQCGDGTIYRASGFVLTSIKKNRTAWRHEETGHVVSRVTMEKGKNMKAGQSSMASYRDAGYKPIEGFQLRYMYFLDPTARQRLTVPILPFSAIAEQGAGMYRGHPVLRGKHAMAGSPGTAEVRHLPPRSTPSKCCGNPAQCWEPCGDLGKSAEHAAVAPSDPMVQP